MMKYLAWPLLLLSLLVADVTTTQAKDVALPLQVSLSKKADGPASTDFGANTPAIFATFHGVKLTKGDKIRFVWIIEDGGKKITPNYKLSEYSTVAAGPEGAGFSQLNKPATGWPLGKYRVDVFVNAAKVESLTFTIK